jgi:hypothetical protein
MTYPLANRPELAAASSIVSMLDWLDTVQLVSLKANYERTRWTLSFTQCPLCGIADNQIGTIEQIPSWLVDDTFEGNPAHIYQCHPYGHYATQAEAIGRLFVGWLVEQKIATPEVYTADLSGSGFEYI